MGCKLKPEMTYSSSVVLVYAQQTPLVASIYTPAEKFMPLYTSQEAKMHKE